MPLRVDPSPHPLTSRALEKCALQMIKNIFFTKTGSSTKKFAEAGRVTQIHNLRNHHYGEDIWYEEVKNFYLEASAVEHLSMAKC